MLEEKKKRSKFNCFAPFRCNEEMYKEIEKRSKELGFDSISAYVRSLVKKDLGEAQA